MKPCLRKMRYAFAVLSTVVLVMLTGIPAASANNYSDVLLSQIDYSDPSTGNYVASPSIVKLSDGTLLASDDYGPLHPVIGITRVFRSTDQGATWAQTAPIEGQYWSTLFEHNGDVYLLGTDKGLGSIVIRKSADGGLTWSAAAVLFQETGSDRYHCAPTPVLNANGRLYKGFEQLNQWGMWASVISVPESADLMDPANWIQSDQSDVNLYIEGNAVVGPDGQVWDVLRRSVINRAGIYKLGADNKTFTKYGEFDMPGGDVKFTIRYDSVSGKYIALVNEHTDYNVTQNNQRNVLSLVYSTDLVHWTRGKLLIQDDENLNWGTSVAKVGFQYIDWQFDGDNLIYVSRTSYDGADSKHNANRLTFHRLQDFRTYLQPAALIGDYSFNGHTDDDSAQGNHPIPIGTTVYTPGKSGRAIKMDGSKYFNMHYMIGNEIANAEAISISVWINPRQMPAAGTRYDILGTRIDGMQEGLELSVDSDAVRLGARSDKTDAYQSKSISFNKPDSWHHIVGVVDFKNKTMKLYLDKVEQSPGETFVFGQNYYRRYSPSQEDRIGGNPGGGSNFIGKMDELKIYRKALTQSEIDDLYDSVKRGNHSSTGETDAVF
ncbi:sialidase family protein [Paenibacillus azoreducens]|uniref:sialidase family protein n=1 Tax=Paenibacillus azoreducens TaxID=116718 RepID=UPI0039F4FE57